MASRDELRAAGLRAYELGRLRFAAGAALYLVPLGAACALETGAREACACLGALLLAGSIFLRWRDRRGVERALDGLTAGGLPLVAALIAARLELSAQLGVAISVAAGAFGGAWLGVRSARRRESVAGWLTTVTFASLAACLGCVALGPGASAGASAGIAAASGVAAQLLRPARSSRQ